MIYSFRLKAFTTTTKESERSIVSPVNLAAKTKNKNSKTILIDRNIARAVCHNRVTKAIIELESRIHESNFTNINHC